MVQTQPLSGPKQKFLCPLKIRLAKLAVRVIMGRGPKPRNVNSWVPQGAEPAHLKRTDRIYWREDNLPAREVRKLAIDKVLSVKFAASLQYEPKNAYDIGFKAVDILFDSRAQEALEASDFTLDLDLAEASVFNIKKIDYCYNIGYISTITKMNEIKQMLKESGK